MIPVRRAHPILIPQPLQRLREPFDDPDWLFELKYDGFRALAYIEDDCCRLISRNGNSFGNFRDLAARLPRDVRDKRVVLDGEIVCLDATGKPQFYDLLYRRAEPCFAVFDVMYVGDEDLRGLYPEFWKHLRDCVIDCDLDRIPITLMASSTPATSRGTTTATGPRMSARSCISCSPGRS